jgi:hypothetical protein
VSAAPGGWVTLKELDAGAGCPKGSAFRAFKRLEPSWREGVEFRALRPERDAGEIAALRAAGRAYASSRTVVLLSAAAATAVRAALG